MANIDPVTIESIRSLVSKLLVELADPEDHLGSVPGAKLAFALRQRTGVVPYKALGYKRLSDFLKAECPDVIIEKDDGSTDMRVSLRGAVDHVPSALTENVAPLPREIPLTKDWTYFDFCLRRYGSPTGAAHDLPDERAIFHSFSSGDFKSVVARLGPHISKLLALGDTKPYHGDLFSLLACLFASDAELCADQGKFETAADLHLAALHAAVQTSRVTIDPWRYTQYLAGVSLGASALEASAVELRTMSSDATLNCLAIGLGRAASLSDDLAAQAIDKQSPLYFNVRDHIVQTIFPNLLPPAELKKHRLKEIEYRAIPTLGEITRSFRRDLAAIPGRLRSAVTNELASIGSDFLQYVGRRKALLLPSETASFADLAGLLGRDLGKFVEIATGGEESPKSVEFLARYASRLTDAAEDMRSKGLVLATTFFDLVSYLAQSAKRLQLSTTQQRRPQLVVKHTTKRYPLKRIDRDLVILVEVLNAGAGPAESVSLSPTVDAVDALSSLSTNVLLGTLPPDEYKTARVELRLHKPLRALRLDLELTFTDLFGDRHTHRDSIAIESQGDEPDWDALYARAPYSLEPLTDERALRGRRAQLDALTLNVQTRTSTILWGQKRVGKSSVARVLHARLQSNPNVLPIYVTKGDVAGYDEGAFARDLAERLLDIASTRGKLTNAVELPSEQSFSGRITRLTRVADTLRAAGVALPFVVIIDEFDELNRNFYRGERGSNFFGTIRALSERQIIFVLVGSEQLPGIFRRYSQQLNKFAVIRIDRIEDAQDLQAMITQPVEDLIEYEPEAVRQLAYLSGGNPYYVNLICLRLLRSLMTSRRTYVDSEDVREVGSDIAKDSSTVHWSHLWEDNDADDEFMQALESARAALVLSAFSERRPNSELSTPEVKEWVLREVDPRYSEAVAIENTLEKLVERRVLGSESEGVDRRYNTVVPIFRSWLKSNGRPQLLLRYRELPSREVVEEDARLATADAGQMSISFDFPLLDEDLIAISEGLFYRHKQVDPMRLKQWLRQFRDDARILLAFKLLKALRHRWYIDDAKLGRLEDKAYDLALKLAKDAGVTPSYVRSGKTSAVVTSFRSAYLQRDEFTGVVANVYVSYIGAGTKSGPGVARAIKKSKRLSQAGRLDAAAAWLNRGGVEKKERDQQFVMVVDDFVGSGYQAGEELGAFVQKHRGNEVVLQALKQNRIVYVPFVAYEQGVSALERLVPEIPVRPVQRLDENDQAFTVGAEVFDSDDERRMAEAICSHIGSQLHPDHPLGWKNLQSLVVFPDSVPNATLPIFWRDGMVDEHPWMALFPR